MRRGVRRSLRLLPALTALAASTAFAQTDTTFTFRYPVRPPPGTFDDDGFLVRTDQTFQEGGMHVEGFWVRNVVPGFDAQGHLHIIFPNSFEQSHGWASVPGLGPDRQGVFLRREDGGPFDFQSLDYLSS